MTQHLIEAIAFRRDDQFLLNLQITGHPDYFPAMPEQPLLHYAIRNKNLYAVTTLLAHGASPNAISLENLTALDVAFQEDDSTPEFGRIIQVLKKNGAEHLRSMSRPEIQNSLQLGYQRLLGMPFNPEHILRLLQCHPQGIKGFFEDFTDRHRGRTPLHYAVIAKKRVLMDFWLAQDVPKNSTDASGSTPLSIEKSSENPDMEIVQLLEYAANPEETDKTSIPFSKQLKNRVGNNFKMKWR